MPDRSSQHALMVAIVHFRLRLPLGHLKGDLVAHRRFLRGGFGTDVVSRRGACDMTVLLGSDWLPLVPG